MAKGKLSTAYIKELLESPLLREGAYSQVIPVSPTEVVKISRCPATAELLSSLLRLQKQNKPHPQGLPLVLEAYGQVLPARQDEAPAYAWRLERLFDEHDVVGMAQARAHRSRQDWSRKPHLKQAVARTAWSLEDLKEALRYEREQCGFSGWKASHDMAMAMTTRLNDTGLRATFEFLATFVKIHRRELDVLTQGNLMLDRRGYPCFSDPVSPESVMETETPSAGYQGEVLGARVPFSLEGLYAQVRPVCSAPLSSSGLKQARHALQLMGVATSVFQWGSEEHIAFLNESVTKEPSWRYPYLVHRLKAEAYLHTLLTAQ